MSTVSDTAPEGAWRRRGGCGRLGWTPFEVAAVVLGFMVFWPIGLGLIALKFYRRRALFEGEWFDSVRDRFEGYAAGGFGGGAARRDWHGFGRSGNAAFDEWRKSEIERLEAERRKLEAAQKEFADFVAEARRARDREEFERFMRNRPQPQG